MFFISKSDIQGRLKQIGFNIGKRFCIIDVVEKRQPEVKGDGQARNQFGTPGGTKSFLRAA